MFLGLITETHGVASDRRGNQLLFRRWSKNAAMSVDDPAEMLDLTVFIVVFDGQQHWIRPWWQICFTFEQSWLGPAKGAKYFQPASRFPTKVHLVSCAILLLWNTQIHLFLRLFWQRILGIDCSKNRSNHNLDKWIELGSLQRSETNEKYQLQFRYQHSTSSTTRCHNIIWSINESLTITLLVDFVEYFQKKLSTMNSLSS